MAPRMSITEVNSLSREDFVKVFANVVELYNDAAAETEKKRPFANVLELYQAFFRCLDKLDEEQKLVVLKLHPDLAGRLAKGGGLSKESTKEQSSAGLHELTGDQRKCIDDYNERYKSKFGFPFIICVRENKIQAIIDGLQHRYNNTIEEEFHTAIGEVKKITKLRILDIVKET